MPVRTDLRDAIRALVARPTFSIALLLTLGLGIGATTTVYSFVYALLLRPYPYRAPDELVRVQSVYTKEGGARRGMGLLDVDDFGKESRAISGIGGFVSFDTRLLTDAAPVVVSSTQLDAGALALLGVEPVLGRLFKPEEDVLGGDVNKAVIAYELWQSQFGGDPAILGKALRTDRLTYTIVGVMPSGFAFPNRVSFWTPMESWFSSFPPGDDRRQKWRGAKYYNAIARLAPGYTLQAAQQEMNTIAAALERDYPRDNDGVRVALTPLREFEMGDVRPYLLVCLVGVALVLLICCANVANLLLVRTAARRREIAVKAALGASTRRIVSGLLTESLLVGGIGAVVGVAIGWIGVRGLLALIPAQLPAWVRVEVDGPVLALAALVGIVTALLFGLAPVLAGARVQLTTALRDGARGSTRSPVRAALVVVEIALSVLLLVASGLLVETFLQLQHRNPGFQPQGIAAAKVVLWSSGTRTESATALGTIHDRILDSLRAIPGVRSAAVTNYLPNTSATAERMQADIFIKGRAAQDTKTLAAITGSDVSADYFSTMRIPLQRGRLFDATDATTSEPVIVISERAANVFWPNQDPIGQYISWGPPTPENPWTRVVGIVGNVKHHAAEGESGVEFYYHMWQWPTATSHYVVRTDSDPGLLLDTVRRTINIAEPTAAVASVKTVERTMTEALWQRRLWGVLFSAFAVLALTLAAVGVYGVISYAVAQRTREMGVRIALGAAPSAVQGLILREGLTLCGIGLAIGLLAALALGQFVASFLFGVTPYDLQTYASVCSVILLTVLIACWWPAVRASRVDPTTSLRAE